MVPRYTLPEMGKIWNDENKYYIWMQIEVFACEAQAELGLVPEKDLQIIRKNAKVDVERILKIEETTKHDVIAFLTNLEENIGESARYIHLGMTSSDVLDTCFAVQCKQAGELLLKDLFRLEQVLMERANEFKYTVCVGRTHGIHAEPITFGLKLALWYEECKRNIIRMQKALDDISFGKINGAVGTFEHISPKVEDYVCAKFGLKPDPITTQVIQRDRHAQYLTTIAIIGSMLEKIATEVRHSQRTEVGEVEEFFSIGQKGSSAMPHKRNPIISENICGQARLLRSYATTAIENNALWHERDISHSSVERVIFPDSTISCHYILNKSIDLIRNLVVYDKRMRQNLDLTLGLIHSQKVLLALANKGLQRQKAYSLVQSSAMRTFNEKIPFLQTLVENQELMEYFSDENELKKLFDFEKVLFKSVDCIFEKCGL
ncbi:MAG: adenylosuccinate lyase [Bacteroidota bacterium]